MGTEDAAGGGELQAVVLAGGKGERLRPLTDDRPKPMVHILGRPILEYQVRWLVAQGVRRIVFACGYRHEVIRAHFGDGERFGAEIRYAVEAAPLGRGGALKRAWEELEPSAGPVVATNGDVVTNIDLAGMLSAHRRAGAPATVLVVPYTSQVGIVDLDEGGGVTGFRSEPVLPYWINGGVYVLERGVRALLPERGDHETSTFPRLAGRGDLHAAEGAGYWWSVDTVKDVDTVTDHLSRRLLDAFLGR